MQESIQDVMRYESDIWSVVGLLIAANVKQSDFPAFMMPFFAVICWRVACAMPPRR